MHNLWNQMFEANTFGSPHCVQFSSSFISCSLYQPSSMHSLNFCFRVTRVWSWEVNSSCQTTRSISRHIDIDLYLLYKYKSIMRVIKAMEEKEGTAPIEYAIYIIYIVLNAAQWTAVLIKVHRHKQISHVVLISGSPLRLQPVWTVELHALCVGFAHSINASFCSASKVTLQGAATWGNQPANTETVTLGNLKPRKKTWIAFYAIQFAYTQEITSLSLTSGKTIEPLLSHQRWLVINLLVTWCGLFRFSSITMSSRTVSRWGQHRLRFSSFGNFGDIIGSRLFKLRGTLPNWGCNWWLMRRLLQLQMWYQQTWYSNTCVYIIYIYAVYITDNVCMFEVFYSLRAPASCQAPPAVLQLKPGNRICFFPSQMLFVS